MRKQTELILEAAGKKAAGDAIDGILRPSFKPQGTPAKRRSEESRQLSREIRRRNGVINHRP